MLGETIYKEFAGYESNAVIATLEKRILMPKKDYMVFYNTLNTRYAGLVAEDKGQISSKVPCAKFQLGNLTLRIAGLYYRIPQIFFTKDDGTGGCEFLVGINKEYKDDKDQITTDDGAADKDTNNGFILGRPFLKAFMIFLNFENNKIGFANKLNNYGALITSQKEKSAPSTVLKPDAPTTPTEPVDPDEPDVKPVKPIPLDEDVPADKEPIEDETGGLIDGDKDYDIDEPIDDDTDD